MPTAFTRTLRSLDADRFVRPGAAIASIAALLGAWAAWAALSHVTLRAVSDSARIEVDEAAYAVQSPMAGRVVRTYLALGKEVKAGEPLVELDASPERFQYREERTRASAVAPSLDALQQQIEAELQARAREQEASRTAIEQARATSRSAAESARFAAGEEQRLERLRKEGLVPDREYQRARSDAAQARTVAERDDLSASRLADEQRAKETDRDARIRGLRSEIAKLQGQVATSHAASERLANEIDRRIIRAPVSGRLGEAQMLRAGGVLDEGDKIAAIVPDGNLRVVAQFAPAAALGRLHAGQKADVRLEGYPWAQWGTAPAIVSRVATEIRDGTVRVELTIDPSRPCRIPLQHGMPGAVEVAVERITPATLILRLAGGLLGSPRNPYGNQGPS